MTDDLSPSGSDQPALHRSAQPSVRRRHGALTVDLAGRIQMSSPSICELSGYTSAELTTLTLEDLFPGVPFWKDLRRGGHWCGLVTLVARTGGDLVLWASFTGLTARGGDLDAYSAVLDEPGEGGLSRGSSAADRERAATPPPHPPALGTPTEEAPAVRFEDLFDLDEVQRLQDLLSDAFGVASLITKADGTPITQPSRFCDLCSEVIRKTPKGLENCNRSDAMLGRFNPKGPNIQPCLSAGLWGAGASIQAAGQHIANWVIGQVRDEDQDEGAMLAYARRIDVDPETYRAAYRRVPSMKPEQFERVSQAMSAVVNQLSASAYQNLMQARTLADLARAERALRRSEDRYREAQELARIGHWSFDPHAKRFLASSEVALALLGLEGTGGRADYAALLARIHPEDREDVDLAVERSVATGAPFLLSHRVLTDDGGVRYLEVRGVTHSGADGQVSQLSGTVMDITERTQAELELQRHREHLEDLVTERTVELQRAMGKLIQVEKLAALGKLVAGVAHELSTPLGNARMLAGTLSDDFRALEAELAGGALRRGQLDDFMARGREAAALLERSTARAADLIGHFKEVAVDQTSMRRRRFNLRQTIEEVLSTIRPILKRTSHRVEINIPEGLELDGYPGPLEQVMTNLIANSLTHGFSGIDDGCIRIEAGAVEPDAVRLLYRDDGVGIRQDVRARVFDPFFTTRLGHGGSGLGLYIVYNLVTGVLGGTIELAGDPHELGATFILTMPRRAPDGGLQASQAVA